MFFRPATILVTFLAALQAVTAAPVAERRGDLAKRAFTERAYKDFQISSGTAGNALAKANAVFVGKSSPSKPISYQAYSVHPRSIQGPGLGQGHKG